MSEILENTIEELRLDKSKWKLTKFGDVAIQQKGKVDRENTTLKRYIKGEHMGSEDLHIRKWGNLTDEYLGPAFIRKFEKGDILYGSRRTYLRKVAIADFDGITSNTTLVIKANEEKIDKRLLPFVMMSEDFTENSIKNSKGSVNPYINWKDIAKYEFLLPPKDQQAKLAELLWAMDEVVERENEVLRTLTMIKRTIIKDYFSKASEIKQIKQLGTIITGNTPSTKMREYWGHDIPFITPADIGDSPYINKVERFLTELGKTKSRVFPPNSILTVCIGSTIGKVAINKTVSCSNQQINALVPNKKYHPLYLLYLIRYHKSKIMARTGSTAVPLINKSEFSLIKLPVISDKEMEEFVEIISNIDSVFAILEAKTTKAKALQKSLINQVF